MDFRLIVAAGFIAAAGSVCTLTATATPTEIPSTITATVPAATGTATLPPPTETPAATATLRPGAIELNYGVKFTSAAANRPSVVYAFRGQAGDIVTMRLEITNSQPRWVYCRAPYSTDLVLDSGTTFVDGSPMGSGQSVILSYKLPGSGVYYLTGTCRGSSCNRECYAQTIVVDKP